jgi:hypothetical protein
MTRTKKTPKAPSTRPRQSLTGTLPVLIEVPATFVPRTSRRALSPNRARRWSNYRVVAKPASRRRTRKLRQEVRTAARVLSLVSLMCLVWGLGSISPSPSTAVLAMPLPQHAPRHTATLTNREPIKRPDHSDAVADSTQVSVHDSPIALLSAEPTLATMRPESEIPVVLPGYVLPDDSFEESSHEGS